MFKRLVILCSLAGLLAAAVASAQNVVTFHKYDVTRGGEGTPIGSYVQYDSTVKVIIGGVSRDSTFTFFKFFPLTANSSGYPYVAIGAGPTPNVRAGTTPIIDDTTAVGGADSSAVINVSAYKSLGLLVHVGGLGYARLAIQLRYHLNAGTDSSSVFPIALRADSVSTDGAAVSVVYGGTSVPSPVQGNATMSPYETGLTLAEQSAVAAKWASPASACIPLLTRTGAYAFVNDISVRIRMLGASSSAVGHVTAYLVGSNQ